MPLALRARVSANLVSLVGFALGLLGAASFLLWRDWRFATLGFCLGVSWLIADGLDGMIARATDTASPFGRFLDGLCDHGVFVLIYLSLGVSIGTTGGWLLAVAAGANHALQATLYEGERTRYHRRLRGDEPFRNAEPARNLLVRSYDRLADSMDPLSANFERWLSGAADRSAATARYATLATAPLRLMSLLTNNMRLILIYLACLSGHPRWFWLTELTFLNLVLAVGTIWLRRLESRMVRITA